MKINRKWEAFKYGCQIISPNPGIVATYMCLKVMGAHITIIICGISELFTNNEKDKSFYDYKY